MLISENFGYGIETRTPVCDYGCGQLAVKKFKTDTRGSTGRWCCSFSHNSCPANRRKNSSALIGKPKPWIRGGKNPSKRSDVQARMRRNHGGGFRKGEYKHSPEVRKMISKAHEGIPLSEVHKKRISETLTGRKRSAESRLKQRQSMLEFLSENKAPGCSAISQALFWKLYSEIKPHFQQIYFMELNHEYSAETGRFMYDFTVRDNRKIIEFHGDYWHMNPEFYNSQNAGPGGLKAREIWERDREKLLAAEKNGYAVMILYENAYKKDAQKSLAACINFLFK